MIRLIFVTLATLALAACAGNPAQPKIETVFVDRPMPVSCVPPDYKPPAASPVTGKALATAPDGAARYQLLAEYWTFMQPVTALQNGVIAACLQAQQGRGRP